MRTQRILQAIFWIAVYIALALAPLLLLLIGPKSPRQGFWQLLSVALGFAGLAMMALQFVLTARFKTLKAPYGSDIVYHFHRQISLVAFALVLAHPLILFVADPRTLGLLNFVTAPWRARAAVAAINPEVGCSAAAQATLCNKGWRKSSAISVAAFGRPRK